MHTPLHARLGVRQLHDPAMQPTPAGQSVRQLPQLALSVCKLEQRPPHVVSPMAQPASGGASIGAMGVSPLASAATVSRTTGTSRGTTISPQPSSRAAVPSAAIDNQRDQESSVRNVMESISFDPRAPRAARKQRSGTTRPGANPHARLQPPMN